MYWPGLHGGFIFDDFPNLVADPDWKVTSLDPAQWRRAMAHGISSSQGRPLAMLSFAFNHYTTGMAAFPMKVTNLLFHLLNGVLVYVLCEALFARATASRQPALGRFAAWAVAAAWLLHPMQVSSVLYVVQRMELGAQCCMLLALIAYFYGRVARIEGRRCWPWFALACTALPVGLGFKETIFLAPAFALLLEVFALRFQGHGGKRSGALTGTYAAGVAVACAVFAFAIVPHYLFENAYAFRDFTLGQRLLTQMPVLVTYLGQTVWPIPSRLLFYYDNYPISTGFFSPVATAYAAGMLLLLFAIAAAAWKTWPLVAFGIAWFFVGHALTSNVVPLELAFEHRNYLALLGLLIAIAPPLAWLGKGLSVSVRRFVVLLLILTLATLSAIQTLTWGEPTRLAFALASRNIDSPRASYELGKLLLESAHNDTRSPQWSMARKEFQHAAALPSSPPLAEQALIIMDARTSGEIPKEIWESFRKKLIRRNVGPEEILALHAVSTCRIRSLCRLDDQELFLTFLVALEHNPRSAALHVLYANFAFNVLRDHPLAIRTMREAVRLRPDKLDYQVGLLRFLLASGLHRDDTEVAALLARVRAGNSDGRLDEAIREFEARSSDRRQ
ncbi:hypothetical protein IP90_01980 [Luteimonas cucumeris]|uniref:Tetratricopeptide repeat protein n=1 Tax=Luteimonas cucumeris TaxID=985012 RepID=A0A562L5D8_9GAMM|nr:hypothetical protein IP90_01980 [Luteimonas cucumeris]